MENIKFIQKITDYVTGIGIRTIIGNCVYYNFANGNKIKLWCYELGVHAEVINKMDGKIDSVDFPFANYFAPTQCSAGAHKWTQHIDRGRWYFSQTYTHVLPKDSDYTRLAEALSMYMKMYK